MVELSHQNEHILIAHSEIHDKQQFYKILQFTRLPNVSEFISNQCYVKTI